MTRSAKKVAVVLGASAPNGIGWACVRRFVKEGVTVVAAARSFDRLKRLCDDVGARAVQCDAASREDIEALADTVLQEYGHVDIAVNSAGSGVLSLVADATEEMLLDAMRLNYFGMFHFVQVMARAMGHRPPDDIGSIVLVSTMSVDHPNEPVFPYAAAKGATETLARFAALEFGRKNIKVNTVNPGFVMTDLAQSGGLENLDIVERMAASAAALGRIATADEIADGIFWLGTSAFAAGLNLKICGGGQLRPQFG